MLRLVVAALLLALLRRRRIFAVAAHKTVTLDVDGAQMTVTTMKSRVIDVVEENGYSGRRPRRPLPGRRPDRARRRDHRAAPQPAAADLAGRSGHQAGVDHGVDRRRGARPAADDRHRARRGLPRQPRCRWRAWRCRWSAPRRCRSTTVAWSAPCTWPRPNVAALLAAAGVPLEQSDTVVPAASSPVIDGMQIQVTRIRIEKVTQQVPLVPMAQRIEDPTMNMSRQVVEDPGTPGLQDVTFAVATVNGVETGRLPVANVVIVAGARFGSAGRCQTGHRSAAGDQRSDLGRPCPVRIGRQLGDQHRQRIFTVACNLIRTPGNDKVD